MAIDFESLTLKPLIQTFGTSVVYTPSIGSPQTVNAVFDAIYQSVSPGTDVVVQSTQPHLLVRAADLSKVPEYPETFTVNAVIYTVTEAQPDGQGGLTVFLQKV